MDWLKQNSHPLILLSLVLILLVYSLHVMHAADVDMATLAWCRENTGLVLGGLLTLLTAGAARKASTPQDPPAPPPAQPAAKEETTT